ncbi:L-serine dehydratase [Klebsiella michiganensis]|uniref:L-serine ammonia-lyase n=1 Tax=Klebsiella michiganensis TaxID=1134687 RepID=A0A7H4MWL0_9ENTR|nr:L-serine dehydratase [Klebsiella michiganensis]
MKAGKQFVDDLVEKGLLNEVTRVAVDVYGSLSLTGKGHHTDIAIIMGLAGNQPDTVDIDAIPAFIRDVETRGRLLLAQGQHEVDFPQNDGMRFRSDNLPLHENGMTIHAWAGEKEIYSKTYYSIGGGFIVDEEHFGKESASELAVPYPFKSAQEMLGYCKETGMSLSGMVMQNELALHSKKEIEDYFANIWQTMRACIDRGMNTEGVLPGPLRVPRRASALRRMLVASDKLSPRSDERGGLGQHVRAGGQRRKRRRWPRGDGTGRTAPAVSYRRCWLTTTTLSSPSARISIFVTSWRQGYRHAV